MAEIRALVGAVLRSTLGRLIGPALLAIGNIPFGFWPQLALVALGGILASGSTYAVHRRSKAEDWIVDGLIGDVITDKLLDCVDLVRIYAPAPGHVRANVRMIQEIDGKEYLVTGYNTPVYSDAEEKLKWAIGEGPAGQAWASGLTVVYPNENMPLPRPKSRTNAWQMTPDQIAATCKVKMAVSAPIFDPDHRDQIVGVLSIDDTLPPGEHLTQITTAAEHLAAGVGRQLRRGKLALSDM